MPQALTSFSPIIARTFITILFTFFIISLSFLSMFCFTKLLQKREMRKDIVIELSYKGFSRASDYS